jgi:hypothetical protein
LMHAGDVENASARTHSLRVHARELMQHTRKPR